MVGGLIALVLAKQTSLRVQAGTFCFKLGFPLFDPLPVYPKSLLCSITCVFFLSTGSEGDGKLSMFDCNMLDELGCDESSLLELPSC